MRTNHPHVMLILSLWVLPFLHVQGANGRTVEAWRKPVPVSGVNTEYHEKAPFLSFDGKTLYFGRQNADDGRYTQIYQAARAGTYESLLTTGQISALNVGGAHVSGPWVSKDNGRMYYYTTEAGKRLKVTATRDRVYEPWTRGTDITELNGMGDVVTPTLTEDECVIVFGGYGLPGGHGGWDLWMADRPDRDSPFAHITNLGSLNTEAWDVHPSLTPDGLTLYFMSNRNGRSQIFVARRPSRDAPFGNVEHLSALDTPNGGSEFPSISADGRVLYFGRWPDGSNMDIYVSYAGRSFFVDGQRGSDDANGLSAQAAFATIQRGIEAAEDGDEVLVALGVYCEELRFLGKAITVRSIADAAIIEAPDGFAVSFFMGEKSDTILRNFIIRNSYIGILCIDSSPTITNMTIVGNVHGAEAYGTGANVFTPDISWTPDIARVPYVTSGSSGFHISNSIFWGNTRLDAIGFNVSYSCVQRLQPSTVGGWSVILVGAGNFGEDPLFVDPNHGDYHVRSVRGRYWPEHDIWVLDDVTSPCVDAGSPTADFSAEPKPNGGRLNVGAHGGTAYAEMSEAPFFGDVNGDGVFDVNDYNLFTDLWEEHINPKPPATKKR
jgi:hypothetical protein